MDAPARLPTPTPSRTTAAGLARPSPSLRSPLSTLPPCTATPPHRRTSSCFRGALTFLASTVASSTMRARKSTSPWITSWISAARSARSSSAASSAAALPPVPAPPAALAPPFLAAPKPPDAAARTPAAPAATREGGAAAAAAGRPAAVVVAARRPVVRVTVAGADTKAMVRTAGGGCGVVRGKGGGGEDGRRRMEGRG